MPGDVSSALELSSAAGWNQTAGDWYRLLHLSPGGCRCIEDAGKVIATTTLLPYGTQLAWIGMVLTSSAFRRQGLAKKLIEDAIASAERCGIRTLKLDATEEGRPLYESLGFVVDKQIERWERDGEESNSTIRRSGHAHSLAEHLCSLDTEAFGACRKDLLTLLTTAGNFEAGSKGFVFSRPGRTARYLGPCIARSKNAAIELITLHLERCVRAARWYWDLFPSNQEAARCAASLGFTRRRVLWRMSRGEAVQSDDSMVYAIAGFELG
jgi:ribosomal protein S18 acetylase RimI-like enzyme